MTNALTPAVSEEFVPSLDQHSEAVSPQRVQEIATAINLNDPALSVIYGTETMKEIANFADGLLSRVRAKDAGPVGETLSSLMVTVKDLDVNELTPHQPGFLESLPVIGGLFDPVKRSLARFSTLTDQVETITAKLEESMLGLLRDIEVLEQLYNHNKQFHMDLSVYIQAGQERLEQARNIELPKLKAEADASPDTMLAQKVRDFAERLNRFERRLHDLQLSRMITLQTAPQIRLIQGNNQSLAEKIQTSILSTIPLWKSQIVLALSLHGQKQAIALQKHVADTTNDLLKQNAAMLQDATIDTATQVERAVVDIETLREVHGKLISTIEETLRIADEAKSRRMAVAQELSTMEHDLRDKLTSLAATKAQASLKQAEGSGTAITATGTVIDTTATSGSITQA